MFFFSNKSSLWSLIRKFEKKSPLRIIFLEKPHYFLYHTHINLFWIRYCQRSVQSVAVETGTFIKKQWSRSPKKIIKR